MGPRVKTVADAIELFESLATEVKEQKTELREHKEKQEGVNQAVQTQIFRVRLSQRGMKGEIALVRQDTGEIKKLLQKQRMSWQFWVGIAVAAAPGVWGIISDILKSKGV